MLQISELTLIEDKNIWELFGCPLENILIVSSHFEYYNLHVCQYVFADEYTGHTHDSWTRVRTPQSGAVDPSREGCVHHTIGVIANPT